MKEHNKTKQYLEAVCSQIRYKKIHGEICEEIENHIDDQKEAFKACGMDEETAALKAIEQMGDPVIVGTALDRTHRPKPEWSIIALTFLLLLTGIFIRFFTSNQDFDVLDLLYRQLIFTAVGVGLMAFCYYMDFTFIGKYPKTLFLTLAVLIIFLIVISEPIRGKYVYVSRLLLMFPTTFAGVVYSMRNKGYAGIISCGLFFAVSFIISMIVPSVSSSILLALSCLMVLTIAIFKNWFRVKRLYAILLVYIPVAASLLFVFASGIFSRRITLAFFPYLDPLGAGYIATMIKLLLSSSEFIGQGTLPENFHISPPTPILPDTNGDFLLTYITYRFGWFALICVILLLAVFIIRAFVLCTKQKNNLALFVSIAATSTLAIQVLFYTAVNLGFLLFAPLSLPLLSRSSSYLLVNMCLIGILLSVYRTGRFIKDSRNRNKVLPNSFLKFKDGKIVIDFNNFYSNT